MDPIDEAAKTLGRARRHGNVCDALAVLVLAGGILGAIAAVVIGINSGTGVAVAYVLLGPSVVLFAVLRAIALYLHMAVDRIMIEAVDD